MISFSVRVIFNFFNSRSVSPIPGSTSVKVSRLFRRILLDILCYECTDNTRTIITPSNINIIILQTPHVLDKNDPDEFDVWDSQHIALRDFLFELLKLFESLLLVFALFLLLFEVCCSNLLIISIWILTCGDPIRFRLDWFNLETFQTGEDRGKSDVEMISWGILSSEGEVGHCRLWSFLW